MPFLGSRMGNRVPDMCQTLWHMSVIFLLSRQYTKILFHPQREVWDVNITRGACAYQKKSCTPLQSSWCPPPIFMTYTVIIFAITHLSRRGGRRSSAFTTRFLRNGGTILLIFRLTPKISAYQSKFLPLSSNGRKYQKCQSFSKYVKK